MSRTIARPAVAGALCFAVSCAVAQPASAQSETTQPTATTSAKPVIAVGARKLDVRAGRRTAVRGRVAPGIRGLVVSLQLRRDGRWKPIDRDRTDASGRYRLRERLTRTGSTPVRIRVSAGPGVRSDNKRRAPELPCASPESDPIRHGAPAQGGCPPAPHRACV